MKVSDQLVEMVRVVNPDRNENNLYRRLLKVLEELGETSEACLSVSSPHNYKSKSWEDYREESIDTLIVLIDIALTPITKFPSSAIIAPAINLASDHSFDSLELLYHEKFKVAGAISSTALHLKENDPMGALGAIMKGIDAASNMCFAKLPEDHDAKVIEERVVAIFEKKIAKWNSNMRQYAATDNGFVSAVP